MYILFILWGYAHASPQNFLFWGPGFGSPFWSNIAPASCYFIVSLVGRVRCKHQSSYLKMQNVNFRFIKHLRAAYDPKPRWRIVRQFFPFPCKAHVREAPLPPNIIPISDPKNEPKTSPYTRLSWKCCSCLCCRDVDKRCPMYWKLIRAFQSLQSRRVEALRAPRGLTEATPRAPNILAHGQNEAHGDSKLYNIIVGVPAGLNLKKLRALVPC